MRLYGKWSKGISLVYLVLADFRDVNQSKNMRDKIAQQVHLKWEDIYTQSNAPLSSPPARRRVDIEVHLSQVRQEDQPRTQIFKAYRESFHHEHCCGKHSQRKGRHPPERRQSFEESRQVR